MPFFIAVKKGQVVKQGDPIGMVRTSGDSTGVHLHFEVTIGGKAVMPSVWSDMPNTKGPTNQELLSAVISANLHFAAERESLYVDDVIARAVVLKDMLSPLYPVTDKEWEQTLREIGKYADLLA